MKRVIITGGTGLIGRALANNLSLSSYEVILLSRHPDQVHNLPTGQRAIGWDARTEQGWGPLVEGATAIVNLAGASIGSPPLPWTAGRKRLLRDSRVNAGHAVMAALKAAETKPQALIQSSGINYYGLHGDETLTEADAPGTDFLARLSQEWEASTAGAEALGVRRAIVRTGLVLSRTGGVLPWFALPFRFFIGGPIGSGHQWISWIHLADEVGAIRFLIENASARGPYNLTAPAPVTNREFATLLGRALKRPSFFPTPGFAMKLALGELAEVLVLGGQRVLPQRLEQAGYVFQYREAGPALDAIYSSAAKQNQTA